MAYDKGKPELLIDCIQLEDAISRIPEPRVRAAMILACFGHLFADHDIGALLGGRGKHETGTALIERGIKWVARHEHNRAEDRQK